MVTRSVGDELEIRSLVHRYADAAAARSVNPPTHDDMRSRRAVRAGEREAAGANRAPNMDMSITVGWNAAVKAGVSREEMDEWALGSHRKAIQAIDEGRFKHEIVAIETRCALHRSADGRTQADTMTASGMGRSVSHENAILSIRECQLQEGEQYANRR